MSPIRLALASFALAACGVTTHTDGPRDTVLPSLIRVSGTVAFHGAAPGASAAGVVVAANRLDDDSLVGSATTDNAGEFALELPTTGGYGDIYLVATDGGYVTTYYDFPEILVGDALGLTVDVFAPAAYAALYTTAGVASSATTGVIEVQTLTNATVVVPSPQTVLYNNASGVPDPTAAFASAGGDAYILGAVSESVHVQLYEGSGPTEDSRELRVYPGAVTNWPAPIPFGPEI